MLYNSGYINKNEILSLRDDRNDKAVQHHINFSYFCLFYRCSNGYACY